MKATHPLSVSMRVTAWVSTAASSFAPLWPFLAPAWAWITSKAAL